jgi:hypothetical protein
MAEFEPLRRGSGLDRILERTNRAKWQWALDNRGMVEVSPLPEADRPRERARITRSGGPNLTDTVEKVPKCLLAIFS